MRKVEACLFAACWKWLWLLEIVIRRILLMLFVRVYKTRVAKPRNMKNCAQNTKKNLK